jgi:YesN/AraC family two-component response regulator
MTNICFLMTLFKDVLIMLESYYKDLKRHIKFYHTDKNTYLSKFHLHEEFEICFIISGNQESFVEKRIYQLNAGDLLIVNNKEFHMFSVKSYKTQESILLHFDPSLFRLFSSNECNLLACFTDRPIGERNKIVLRAGQIQNISYLLHKIEDVYDKHTYGSDVLILTYFIELLVAINNAYGSVIHDNKATYIPDKLQEVLTYIDANINEDLSLEELEKRFFINHFYLGRLFRKTIGCNIHEYVLLKRIMNSKLLLQKGYNVTEVCGLSGFNNYNHFIRIFKKYVGSSPGQYKKNTKV